jgi:hypothetical protein
MKSKHQICSFLYLYIEAISDANELRFFLISNAALDFKGNGMEILRSRFMQDVIYRSQIIVVKLV